MFSNRLDQSQMFGRIGVFCFLGVASWFRGHEIQHGVGFLRKSCSFLRRISSWFWEGNHRKNREKKTCFLNKKSGLKKQPFLSKSLISQESNFLTHLWGAGIFNFRIRHTFLTKKTFWEIPGFKIFHPWKLTWHTKNDDLIVCVCVLLFQNGQFEVFTLSNSGAKLNPYPPWN